MNSRAIEQASPEGRASAGECAHPHAEVVAIGSELLLGEIASTNTALIGRELTDIGIPLRFEALVGDDIEDIAAALRRACERSPVVVVTGGLGPTGDDLTREAIAQAVGQPLRFDAKVFEQISEFFKARGRDVPESNRRQAMVLEGSTVIPNPNGTAPGVDIALGSARIFALPGVPGEMEHMLRDYVMPQVAPLAREAIAIHRLHVIGLGESTIEDRLPGRIGPATARGGPEIQTRARSGWVTLRVVARADTREAARQKIEAMLPGVRKALDGHIFAEGDVTLAEAALAALSARGHSLALAESCTGGLIAAAVTDVPGASRVFREGFVTYSNEAKTDTLNVPRETLETHGAVSEETAAAMARGARARSGASLALAVTGIAGPEGGSPRAPVGTVCLAIDTARGGSTKRLQLRGTRAAIRERTVHQALDMIRQEALK